MFYWRREALIGDVIFQLFMILIPLITIGLVIAVVIYFVKRKKQLDRIEKKLDNKISKK